MHKENNGNQNVSLLFTEAWTRDDVRKKENVFFERLPAQDVDEIKLTRY